MENNTTSTDAFDLEYYTYKVTNLMNTAETFFHLGLTTEAMHSVDLAIEVLEFAKSRYTAPSVE